ncbi:hypothetical protein R1sor_023319 [Riccia sorocarpa]|uniref:CCHC-type domain-containing protein n=1 Tax=Riccia sorocarpa TaxID=122646 RepID=A0ABD3GN38_9MARC
MAQHGTKIRYLQFKGRSGTDPDVFLNEFKQIAVANREGTEPDYLRLFPALLKGRASRCMGLQCMVGPRSTITEVIATAEAYEVAKRTEQSKERRKPFKGRTSDSGSSESDHSSGSDTNSDDGKTRKPRKKTYRSKKKHSSNGDTSSEESAGSVPRTRKVKTREHADIDTLTKELADLKVQIATPKDKRRDPKAVRYNLWCANCHNSGHTKEDCRLPKSGQSYYVDEVTPAESEDYYTEGADGTVYHVSMGGNSNIPRFAPVRYNPPEYVGGKTYPSHGPPRHPPNPAITKVHGPVPPSEITCFRCQEKGHYANACPNAAKSPGYIPLCQNCGEPRHIAPHCAKPNRPKVNFVDLPSTSGTKKDVPVHLMTLDKSPAIPIATERSRPQTKVVRFDPRVLEVTTINTSGSESWPSDKE